MCKNIIYLLAKYNRSKWAMNACLDSDQVWGAIVKAFEQIFQFLQLPPIKGAQVRLDV